MTVLIGEIDRRGRPPLTRSGMTRCSRLLVTWLHADPWQRTRIEGLLERAGISPPDQG
jgi:hypothetical protein